jgi:SAM-dependent methyltransferase
MNVSTSGGLLSHREILSEHIMSEHNRYIPALSFRWLTPLYDPLLRWGMREKTFKRRLITQANIQPGQRVLDLGCGTGTLTILVKLLYPDANVVGLEGEEYHYWQKVSALKERLDLLSRLPEPAIERAARTLLNLRESWEWATKEERKDLARMMIQEVGVDVAAKRVIWIKARPDFDVLFQLLNNLRVDEQRRFWIAYPEADENDCDIREDLGQMGMEVKIAFPVSGHRSSS